MFKYLMTILFSILLFSCGPSNEELEQEKQRLIDSIKEVESVQRIQAEENARYEERASIERQKQLEQEEKELQQQKRMNNPLTYLTFKIFNEQRGVFNKDRLQIQIINVHREKRIANVKFRVLAFSKTDVQLGHHDEVIYDFVNPNEGIYNRMIDYNKFHKDAKKFNVQLLSADFE